MLNGDCFIKAPKIIVNTSTKEIWIKDKFYAEQKGARLIADYFYNNDTSHIITLENVAVELNDSDIVVAESAEAFDEHNIRVKNGAFSSCKKCINKQPIWQIKADETYIDTRKNSIMYKNTRFVVANTTIFYSPFFSHYLKNAEATSGILRPEIYKGSVRIPLYLRIKSNIDATYTPRISKDYSIHEFEYRHLFKNTRYNINHSQMLVSNKLNNLDNKTNNRFHTKFNAKHEGEWADYNILYEDVSDQSYLKNYYDDNRIYLKSYAGARQLDYNKNMSIVTQKYKGLRSVDSNAANPVLAPDITARQRWDLDNGSSFLLEDKLIRYTQKNKDIVRNSIAASLSRNFYSKFGGILNVSLASYTDFYNVRKIEKSPINIKNKNFIRSIPEIQIGAKIPLYSFFAKDLSVLTEPQINLIYSPKQRKPFSNVNLIDSPNIDINDNNIFNNSRYSGIDFRENGLRSNFGVAHYLKSHRGDFSCFIGRTIGSEKDLFATTSNYVGRAALSINKNINIYYSFQRRAKSFKPVRDEVSLDLIFSKVQIENSITFLRE
ncbi:MAG: LPS assembly protein LptD, partial [Rickettsiaceae bacterium]|nr:LPS assembly protein LptD [Rickettsiaceae bacterium]